MMFKGYFGSFLFFFIKYFTDVFQKLEYRPTSPDITQSTVRRQRVVYFTRREQCTEMVCHCELVMNSNQRCHAAILTSNDAE